MEVARSRNSSVLETVTRTSSDSRDHSASEKRERPLATGTAATHPKNAWFKLMINGLTE